MIAEYDYHCPHCDHQLNEENEVVFTFKKEGVKHKIFLNPKPGTYGHRCEPETDFSDKELVSFYCPKCKGDLVSDEYDKYIKIILKVTPKVSFDVLFSRIYGVQKTYVITDDFVEEFGDALINDI